MHVTDRRVCIIYSAKFLGYFQMFFSIYQLFTYLKYPQTASISVNSVDSWLMTGPWLYSLIGHYKDHIPR